MEQFFQAAAMIFVALILILVINPHSKEIALLLTLCVCCLVAGAAGEFLQPVIEFLENVQQIGQLDNLYLGILLKIVGIGFLAEITALVCTDAGNATLGKTLQMLASCVILWLSIPLLNSLLELVQDILGEL